MSRKIDDVVTLCNDGFYTEAINLSLNISPNVLDEPVLAKIVSACYFKLGEFSKAFALLESLESIYYNDVEFLSLFASTSRRLGDLTRSEVLFKRAISIDPDSISLKNNYANLLIDLHLYQEARLTLNDVLQKNPTYSDSIVNLNRLNHLESTNSTSTSSISAASSMPTSQGFSLADPLLLAFADSEIEFAAKRYSLSSPKDPNVTSNMPLPDSTSSVHNQIELAYQACKNEQYDFALKLCSQALKTYGPFAEIYDCSSDIYLNLREFYQSEICLLHSIIIGGETPKRLLNLVSFSSMRNDFSLAKKYLEKAASLDPSHPQLAVITKSLHSMKPVNAFIFQKKWPVV